MDLGEVLITCIYQYVKTAIFVFHQEININKFSLSKSNKRNLKINEDLKLIKASELINLERYNLFGIL